MKQYQLLYNIKAGRKNIKWERGGENGNFEEDLKKNRGGEEYQVVGNCQ